MTTKDVKLTLAFKKKNPKTGFFGKSICLLTRSNYYHVELIIDDLWVSADSPMGVTINELGPKNHEHWDYVELGTKKVFNEDFDIIMNYVKSLDDKKYDYLAIILSQLIPLKLHNENKLFCSEIVVIILKLFLEESVLGLVPHSTSPKDLARLFGLEK